MKLVTVNEPFLHGYRNSVVVGKTHSPADSVISITYLRQGTFKHFKLKFGPLKVNLKILK